MPGESHIEWTDATLNPTVGCTRVSAGCDNCYAFSLHTNRHNAWLAGKMPSAPVQYHKPFTELQLIPERLEIPLRWTKPRRIFVNSVSDLFHPDVPQIFVAKMWAVMEATPRHTYQILTKRPQRMARMLSSDGFQADIEVAASELGLPWPMTDWPVPNVWLGTSVENQEAAYRLDYLVKTPAAVRFVSAEPLIGPLDITRWLAADGWLLDWVIAGGESGPGYRPAEVEWFQSLADQCSQAVAFFMKQDSGARSGHQGRIPDDLWALKQMPEVLR